MGMHATARNTAVQPCRWMPGKSPAWRRCELPSELGWRGGCLWETPPGEPSHPCAGSGCGPLVPAQICGSCPHRSGGAQ